MKNILLVIENEQSAKFMLEKAAKFLPECLIFLCFDCSNQEKTKDNLSQKIKQIVKHPCEIQIFFDMKDTTKGKAETLENYLRYLDLDAVMLHRPLLGQELPDYLLIKAILKSSNNASVFLCGDTHWGSKIKVLATVDITDESELHQKLNNKVFTVANTIAEQLTGELGILSVLPISLISQELEIVEPEEIVSKNRNKAMAKLEAFVKQARDSSDVSIYLSAGAPADQISSVSKTQKANIVVLGNAARSGIKGLLIGNTAEKILSRLMTDAVIVKQ